MYQFFFFQAEDGIRDDLVTGVQTCALPIFRGDGRGARDPDRQARHPAPLYRGHEGDLGPAAALRTEERPPSLRSPRSRKIPVRIRLPRAEERERRGARGTLAMVGEVPAYRRGRAPGDAYGATAGRTKAAPQAAPAQERVAAAGPGAGLKRAKVLAPSRKTR